jgi:hypothetical protein
MELPRRSSTLGAVSPDLKRILLITAAVTGIFVWYGVAQSRREREAAEKGPADIRGAVVVGDAMLVHEVTEHQDDIGKTYRHRLSMVGIADGQVRARVVIGENARSCGPASAERVWCAYKQLVELRDVKTLAIVRSNDELGSVIGGALADRHPWIDVKTGELHVHTLDNRDVAIDTAGMKARPSTETAATMETLHLDYSDIRSFDKPVERDGVRAEIGTSPKVIVGRRVNGGEVYRYDGAIK